jgi:hypothetical protein
MRCMYYLLLSVCFGATISLAASAQTPAPAPEPAQQVQTQESGELRKRPGNSTLEEGSQARLSLQTNLSSKLNEVGDPIEAVLYEPLRDAQGRVLVPRGTEFFGRITQVQAAKRPQKQATMTIVFETMRMPYGAEKISTVVTAIDDYANDEKYRSKDDEGKVGGGKSGGRTAENAGRGAGLGGVGGLIVVAAGGGLGGLATAVGVGAAGGVLMTKGNDIRLAPGTILRIRFERDVQIPVTEP